MNTDIKTQQRRIILVTGLKGGVGKSVMARQLLDRYLRVGAEVDAYDSDQDNPDLSRFYKKKAPVLLLDLSSKMAFDTVLDRLATGQNRAMVDLAAGAGGALRYLIKGDINLAAALQELEAKLTLVFVISRSRPSLAALRQSLTDFENVPADWVIVRNNYYGEPKKFSRYESSNAREIALARGAVELDMPELLDDLFDDIDQSSTPFCDALDSETLSFTNRRRIRAWVERFDAELAKAWPVL
jgi:hypothetical protein